MIKRSLSLTVLVLLLSAPLVSGAERFLIAVASDDVEATSMVSNSAGRSRYYLLFSGTDFVQVLDNPFLAKGPGVAPSLIEYLAQKGVGVVIAGGFGPLMIESMNQKGMKYMVFSGIAQEGAERALNVLRPLKKDEKKGIE
jgi:predicted Fe-Mo cluster-binding NifX family protein